MSDANVDRRLAALESRLGRLEQLLATVNDKLDRTAPNLDEARRGIQAWVTEYVSLRLQQLVPETCEHPERDAPRDAEEGLSLIGIAEVEEQRPRRLEHTLHLSHDREELRHILGGGLFESDLASRAVVAELVIGR